MFDCSGVGALETPGMSIEGVAESCASISDGVGDIGGRWAGKNSGGWEATGWRREFFSEVAPNS
jgi:hypothetical protein